MTNQKITTIIFDLGGIVVPLKEKEINQEISKYLNIKESQLKSQIKKFKPQITTGKMPLAEFYQQVLKNLDINPIHPKDVLNLHLESYQKHCTAKNPKILDLISKLKKRYTVVCLTNTEPEVAEINKNNGLFDLFHKAYISTELHLMKPDKKIFWAVLDDLKIKPEQSISIDDLEKYVQATTKLGINSILYSNPNQLINALSSFSIQV